MADRVLEVEGLNAWYMVKKTPFSPKEKKVVLHDLSFYIEENEILGLVGESGCGKSSLCKVILGMLNSYDGTVKHYTKRPQVVFQDPFGSLNPVKRVGWILEEPLRLAGGYTKEERQKKVCEMLEAVGLSPEYRKRYPRELSGGQRQHCSGSHFRGKVYHRRRTGVCPGRDGTGTDPGSASEIKAGVWPVHPVHFS